MQDVWESSSMNKSSPEHQDHAKSLLSPKQDLQRVCVCTGAFLLLPGNPAGVTEEAAGKKQVAESI